MKESNAFREKVFSQIPELSDVPLFGNALPFDWEKFSHLLASQFDVPDFMVRLKEQKLTKKGDAFQGFKLKSQICPIFLSPLETPLYWAMSKSDMEKLTGSLFSEKPKKKAFASPVLQEGYYRYLLLEAIYAARTLDPIREMTPCLEEEGKVPEEEAFCVDVEISVGESVCWGRLILTESFRKEWVDHFSAFPPQYAPTDFSQRLSLTLGVRIGSVRLNLKEWKKLEEGDFLVLDKIEKGDLGVLMLKNAALFNVRRSADQIELTEYAIDPEEPTGETPSEELETSEEESTAAKDVSILVEVEIDRLQMTLDKLMHLSPGNTLELPEYADKKVVLTVDGEKVGVAELITLGETPGLKILEI